MLQTIKNKSKRIASTLAAGVLLFSQLAFVPTVGATDSNHVSYWCGDNSGGVLFNTGAVGTHAQDVTGGSVSITIVDPGKTEVSNATGNGVDVKKVIVKGGNETGWQHTSSTGWKYVVNGNLEYDAPFNYNLIAPKNNGGQQSDISHVIVCYDDDTTIKVVKKLQPANDAGKFNLEIDAVGTSQGDTTITNIGDNGTTGKVVIRDDKDVVISEAAYTGSDLDNYTTTIACVYENGNPVALSDVDVTGDNRDAKIDKSKISEGDDIVCTFTNTSKYGGLKIVKDVVNDNGNSKTYADFTFTNNGGAPFALDADVADANDEDGVHTFANLTPGSSFDIDEVEANTMGYTTSYEGCEGTIEAGVTKVCTITNNDIDPKLTLVKKIVKDNGGQASASDWTLKAQDGDNAPVIDDNPVEIDEYTAATAATETAPGSYTLSEYDGPNGYKASDWECDGGVLNGNVITLTWGDNVTCTITNDDIAPLLTVNKNVTNNNGGSLNPSNFPLTVGGLPVLSGVQASFNAGTYAVSEEQQPGYLLTGWGGACELFEGVLNITLELGGVYTCNLTNDDQPAKITVKKIVVNNNGGKADADDFKLWVNGTQVYSDVAKEFNGNLPVTVSESHGPNGYKATFQQCWDVTGAQNVYDWEAVGTSFTTELGHEYFCKIVNDDKPAKLKIVKDSHPDSIQVFDFTLEKIFGNYYKEFKLNDNNTSWPVDNDKTFYLDKGLYKITEAETEGWYLYDIKCWGTKEFANIDERKVVVKLDLGDDVTCKFENKKFSQIKGFKYEDVNKNYQKDEGEPKLTGWTITLDKLYSEFDEISTVTDENGWYKFDGLKTGWYKVCEVQQAGWVQTAPHTESGCKVVFLKPGDTDFVFFGNFKFGQVTGVKYNDINGNGVRDEGEPTLKNWEITLTKKCVVEVIDLRVQNEIALPEEECKEEIQTTKTDENGAYSFEGLDLGTYTVCEVQQDKWTQTAPKGDDGCYEVEITTSGQVVEDQDFGNKAKPQVLTDATTTTPQELVKTGASATISAAFGLVILSVLGTLHFLFRRESYQNQ